jgi:hypothetical protein
MHTAAAGRGHSDLSQHPVFPWVLKDWSSEQLDLQNPDSYRDLAWPIAAQHEQQVGWHPVVMKLRSLNWM